MSFIFITAFTLSHPFLQPSHLLDLDFYSHTYYRDVHTAVIFISSS